jgi:type VI secretion system protein ImpM
VNPVPGLWGKMPAHGDFVRRGWSDAAVTALDAWVSPALASCRDRLGGEGFAEAMRSAPLWHGLLPAGLAGPAPLRLVMAPSIDRAGRLFPLLLGVEGEGDWADPAIAEALETALYAAIGGRVDADGALAMIPDMAGAATGIGGWWMDRFDPAIPPDASARPDEELVGRMLSAATQREAA